MATHRCEALIVGGGILGLWVLDRLLEARYTSPILLESDLLGCRQTTHSDAFLHQGYAYYSTNGVGVLIDSWAAWQGRMPFPSPPTTASAAHHIHFDPQKYQAVVAWRQSPNLPAVPPQHNLQAPKHPSITTVAHDAIQTDERCVPGDWILARLAEGKQGYIRKIQEIDRITLRANNVGRLRVTYVDVVMGDGSRERFEPNVLLLCAGKRNRDLVDANRFSLPSGVTLPPAFSNLNQLQRQIEMDMLVVRDRKGVLAEFNGSLYGGTFADKQGQIWNANAFVVSRRDLNQDLVWIASGHFYRMDPSRGFVSLKRDKLFRRMLIKYLSRIFPAFKKHRQEMVWGCYPATLSTWLRPPGQADDLAAQTYTDMDVEGLLVCYSDRLTIAPLAAERIEQEVNNRWPPAAISVPVLPPQPAAVHPEYWRTPGRWEQATSWLWAQFKKHCL